MNKKTLSIAVIVVVLMVAGYFVWREVAHRNDEANRSAEPVSSVLKIGFVGDWEFGTRKRLKHKLPLQATVELKKAVDFLNQEFRPDLVVGGGDYIESSAVKKEKAKAQLAEINDIFKQLHAPRVYALGNHDMRSLTKEEVREILGMAENHTFVDIGEWRVVVVDTNFNKEDDTHRGEKNYVIGYVSKDELAWLASVLETDKRVIVFAHHSPISVPKEDGSPGPVNITNAAEMRSVLEKSGNVVAVISGHTPTSYYEEQNGVHYVIVDTLVNEPALGSFATIELRNDEAGKRADVDVRQYGISPQRYQFGWQYVERE